MRLGYSHGMYLYLNRGDQSLVDQARSPLTNVALTLTDSSRMTKSASAPKSRDPLVGKMPRSLAGCSVAHFMESTSEHCVAVIRFRTQSSMVATDPHSVFVPCRYALRKRLCSGSTRISMDWLPTWWTMPSSRPIADMASVTRTKPFSNRVLMKLILALLTQNDIIYGKFFQLLRRNFVANSKNLTRWKAWFL